MSAIVGFPRPMKRGAKVKRGPCADLLNFPRPLSGKDLLDQWYWLLGAHQRWENEKVSGLVSNHDARSILEAMTGAGLDEVNLRSQVQQWRAVVEKRVLVKDWLETLGVDWSDVRTPEHALNFVFDRLHTRDLPPAA